VASAMPAFAVGPGGPCAGFNDDDLDPAAEYVPHPKVLNFGGGLNSIDFVCTSDPTP